MQRLPAVAPAASDGRSAARGGRCVVILTMSALTIGCAGIRVEYLADETYQPRRAIHEIEWLTQEPAQPHVEVARITVRSASLGEDGLRRRLLDRAYSLGADAVVTEAPVEVISMVGSPYYEQGLLGPAGAAFGLYGYGWYSPYSSNPYLLTQGATDQPRIDRYLSAVAIRYQSESMSSLPGRPGSLSISRN